MQLRTETAIRKALKARPVWFVRLFPTARPLVKVTGVSSGDSVYWAEDVFTHRIYYDRTQHIVFDNYWEALRCAKQVA